jgi:asparagine synthetase B (glutamine-hydrolysing)
MGTDFVKELNGIFGFVCIGDDGANIMAARDHCGRGLHSPKCQLNLSRHGQ